MASTDNTKPENEDKEKRRFVARSLTDIQRIKLEKLMKNPQKEVVITTSSSKNKKNADGMSDTPSFVRNVMGSSAGAGSGEFHVYRHLRRKEYARQKEMQQLSVKDKMDMDFQNRLENNREQSDSKTAKKRAKRLKKKQRAKIQKSNPAKKPADGKNESESSDNDSDENNDGDDTADQSNNDEVQPTSASDKNDTNEPQQT